MAGGLTTTYQYVNGQLLGEEHSDGTALRFTYDPFGALSGIQYKSANGSTTDYYVRCTLNGDVDQIYDTSGNLLARYIYDSWGRTVSILNGSGQEILTGDHIAVVNPIRYRGYYYDGESDLYYLQSRYYDAKTGRYVNPDGYVYTGQDMQSGNMYAYCGNNPIINIDPTGSMYVRGARDVVGVDTQEFTPVPKGVVKGNLADVPKASQNSKTVTDRIVNTVNVILSSPTVNAGLGFGLYGGLDGVLSGGEKIDFLQISLGWNDGLSIGQQHDAGFEIGISGFSTGVTTHQSTRLAGFNSCPRHPMGFCDCYIVGDRETGFSGNFSFGISIYAIVGLNASIEIDVWEVIQDIVKVWTE